jgi:hypothetical protein
MENGLKFWLNYDYWKTQNVINLPFFYCSTIFWLYVVNKKGWHQKKKNLRKKSSFNGKKKGFNHGDFSFKI